MGKGGMIGQVRDEVKKQNKQRKRVKKEETGTEVEESEKAKEQEEGANKRGTRGNAAGYRIGQGQDGGRIGQR